MMTNKQREEALEALHGTLKDTFQTFLPKDGDDYLKPSVTTVIAIRVIAIVQYPDGVSGAVGLSGAVNPDLIEMLDHPDELVGPKVRDRQIDYQSPTPRRH
jgi:hypothetical protein